MREILFRGKRVDTGEWVEGFYSRVTSNFEQKNVHFINHYKDLPNGETVLKQYIIEPETVGQFTGLTDKNGTRIFEGDILSERPPMNETSYIGYVAYDDESAVYRFMIKNDTNYNGVLLGSYSLSYTVIGNIYDNPELLRSENNES
ncbi:MAG: YopX family protein [Acutalibacteraceae bacterium]